MADAASDAGALRRTPIALVSRGAAAILGGYAFAYAATGLLSFLIPLPRGEAVTVATLLGFALYVAGGLWAFAASTALRAWVGLAASVAAMALLTLALEFGTRG
jgi:hypothetical protein